MALFSFFKTPKHQRFKYEPRFYNPQKERLEEIIKNAKGESSSSPDMMKSRISQNFRKRGHSSDYNRNVSRRSNILLLAIIIGLFALSYLLLTVYLPRFIHQIEG